jgi:uncharacterized repeat protein (TIGR01451 family)
VVLLGAGAQAFAATAPGTNIANTATVDYEVSGTPFSEDSNPVTVTVQELVDVDVVVQAPNPKSVLSPSTNQPTQFRVTNLGNGSEQFNLASSNQAGDDFDVTLVSIYRDVDNDDVFEPGAADGAPLTSFTFTSGQIADFWVVVDVPNGRADGDDSIVRLTATSANGTGTAGDVDDGVSDGAGDGDGGVDIIWGNSGGDDFDQATYTVIDISFTFTKAQTVTDPFGGSEVVPGSVIHYTITISATGTATASNVVITDPIPANTTYDAASIEYNNAARTDAADADNCDFNVTNAGQVTCTLPNITGGDPAITIEFEVVIN